MRKVKTLIAKNPSEARGIRKALRAAGLKFEFKSAGKKRRRVNPKRKRNAEFKGLPFLVTYRTLTGKKKKTTVTAHSREEAKELARKRIGRFAIITDVGVKGYFGRK